MTSTTYKARIWKLQARRNKAGKVTSYRVRWEINDVEFGETFRNGTQAESFRAELLTAERKGEAFYTESGLPVSMKRATDEMSWLDFACSYVDMK